MEIGQKLTDIRYVKNINFKEVFRFNINTLSKLFFVSLFEHEVSVTYYSKYLIERMQRNVAAKTQ